MIIDCALHPVLASDRFSDPSSLEPASAADLFGEKYGAPFNQLAVPLDEASSPAAVAGHLRAAGVDHALLAPTTFGHWPNPHRRRRSSAPPAGCW